MHSSLKNARETLSSVPSSQVPLARNVHPLLHLLENFDTSFMVLFRCCPLCESLLDPLADGVPSPLCWAPVLWVHISSQNSAHSPS